MRKYRKKKVLFAQGTRNRARPRGWRAWNVSKNVLYGRRSGRGVGELIQEREATWNGEEVVE